MIRALRTGVLMMVPAFAVGATLPGSELGRAGYAPVRPAMEDTTRTKPSEHPTETARTTFRNVVPGYLSSWGLPPVQGQFTISDTALVFESVEGSTTTLGSRVSLAYIDREKGRSHYLFRFDAGVFETDAPGALLDLTGDSVWLQGLKPRLVGRSTRSWLSDSAAMGTAQQVLAGSYADTLYVLFGRPRAPVGVIGPRGRAAGRLGEYIARRDSLAFDPGRMTGEPQFRHALAHELAHRWQARAREQVAALWAGVPAIRDPKRYGYGERSEHQAEAAAFAVNFLQTTAARYRAATASLSLLDHYELLVPGTRAMVRYLALQPLYRNHPLRSLLTTTPVRSVLEK